MTIMCGLPGAGKDSWLAAHEPTLPVVSLDDIRNELGISPEDNQGKVVQTAKQRCRERLREKTDFALNATNTTRQVRKLWIDLGAEYGARIQLVYVEPKLADILAQNDSRKSRVPERVIERLLQNLDPPSVTECHALSINTQDAR
jgi:predicted kinase